MQGKPVYPTLVISPGSKHGLLADAIGVDMLLTDMDGGGYLTRSTSPVSAELCANCNKKKSPLWQDKRYCLPCFDLIFELMISGMFNPTRMNIQESINHLVAQAKNHAS